MYVSSPLLFCHVNHHFVAVRPADCITNLLTNYILQEHHLQEVLSAAHRSQGNERITRGKSTDITQPAVIPTPDSTGVVDNYGELYLSNKWKDPASYAVTSATVEENIINGLGNGFTYYMDERDKEWLVKNNEEARGEGTSAQGAVSGTRTSSRSAKVKGKEPEACQLVFVSEDEFELVMGVFEKVTHERTEYLHHVCVLYTLTRFSLISLSLVPGPRNMYGISSFCGVPRCFFDSFDPRYFCNLYCAFMDTPSYCTAPHCKGCLPTLER
jgi:hypothetical protein